MGARELFRIIKLCIASSILASGFCLNAASAEVTISPLLDAKDAIDVVATRPSISYSYEIANNSAKTARVTIVAGRIARQDAGTCNEPGGDGCTLSWWIDDKPAQTSKPDTVCLKPGQRVTVRLSGMAPSLGSYETSLSVLEAAVPAKPATIVRLRITRKLDDLGTDPVITINGSRFVSWSGGSVPIQIKNNGSRAVSLDHAPTARLSSDSSEGTYATSADREAISCLPAATSRHEEERASGSRDRAPEPSNAIVQSDGASNSADTVNAPTPAAPRLLSPGETYDCSIAIPELPAGKYRARIRLDQPTLRSALGAVDFSVRLSWLIAAAILLVASAGGAMIARWQNVGRQRMLQAASAMELHVRFTELERRAGDAAPESTAIAHQAVTSLALLITAIDQRSAAQLEAELSMREKQLNLLATLADLEARYVANQGDVGQAVFRDAVTAVETASDQAAGNLSRLRQAIPTAPPEPAGGALFAMRGMMQRMAERVGISTAGAYVLRRRVAFIDNTILAASIVIACLLGVFALWYPNPAWGRGPDLVVAAMTGLGATVGSALSLNSLVSSYTLGRVGGAA